MERRAYPRVPLDVPYFVRVNLETGVAISAMLVDLSNGGLQVAITPQHGDTSDFLGLELIVHDLPKQLDPEGEGCRGLITWVSPHRCGIRLMKLLSLNEDEILHILQQI